MISVCLVNFYPSNMHLSLSIYAMQQNLCIDSNLDRLIQTLRDGPSYSILQWIFTCMALPVE